MKERVALTALVCSGLVLAEWRVDGDALGVPHSIAMCAAFAAVAPWLWRKLNPALYFIVCTAIVAVLGYAVPRALGMGPTLLTDAAGLPISWVLFLAGGWGLGREIELARSVEDAQLLALRAHLDPHFLFNTLNAIAEWCREDPAVAEQATLRLAAMMRVVFEGVQSERWPLSREIALAEDLWSLHRVRDPDRFEVKVDIDGDFSDVAVPPLLLLPIAENAMTHGGRGEVRLSVRRGDGVEVSIESPGELGDVRDDSYGLASVRRRLSLSWGDAASLAIGPAGDGSRTRAVVRLP